MCHNTHDLVSPLTCHYYPPSMCHVAMCPLTWPDLPCFPALAWPACLPQVEGWRAGSSASCLGALCMMTLVGLKGATSAVRAHTHARMLLIMTTMMMVFTELTAAALQACVRVAYA